MVEGVLSFSFNCALDLAGGSMEYHPELHIYVSHGISETVIVPLDTSKPRILPIDVTLKLKHDGPFPADAAAHFNLRIRQCNTDTEMPVRTTRLVASGMVPLNLFYPAPHKDSLLQIDLLQPWVGNGKKGQIELACTSSSSGIVLSDSSTNTLADFWTRNSDEQTRSVLYQRQLRTDIYTPAVIKDTDEYVYPLFRAPTPFDLLPENYTHAVETMASFISHTELDIYTDNGDSKSTFVLKPMFPRAKRVHMPRYITTKFLLPTAFYFQNPPLFRGMSGDSWKRTEPYILNLLRIALNRCNVSEPELYKRLETQFNSEEFLPKTRLVEKVLKTAITVSANRFPYTPDNIAVFDEGGAWRMNPDDRFGETGLTGAGDCEDLTKVMLVIFFMLKSPHYTSKTLLLLGKFAQLYVAECSLTMVDFMSLSGTTSDSSTGNHTNTPVLQNTPESEEHRVAKNSVHMCLILVPVTIHIARVEKLNGSLEGVVDTDEFKARHIVPWSNDLALIPCEGTGYMEGIVPQNVQARQDKLGDKTVKAIENAMVIRANMCGEITAKLENVFREAASLTYVQNKLHAVKGDFSDKTYTPFAVFWSHIAEIFTPFWMEYGVPIVKFAVGRTDGGVHHDNVFRTCIPSESSFLKDENIGYFVFEPFTDAVAVLGEHIYAHEQRMPPPRIRNTTIHSYFRTTSKSSLPLSAVRLVDNTTVEASIGSQRVVPVSTDPGDDNEDLLLQRISNITLEFVPQMMNNIEKSENIAIQKDTIIRADLVELKTEVKDVYETGTDSEKRKRVSYDVYFYQHTFTYEVLQTLVQFLEESNIVEGIHLSPEISMVDAKMKPLNPVIRCRFYAKNV